MNDDRQMENQLTGWLWLATKRADGRADTITVVQSDTDTLLGEHMVMAVSSGLEYEVKRSPTPEQARLEALLLAMTISQVGMSGKNGVITPTGDSFEFTEWNTGLLETVDNQ
ncbi:hypothetical protein D5S17_00510 [Pseudonocardiaceae bacterium YIM PH 21723]|nr:hypothetical protein D5S17_00510 [Pseudonocardiaceae bacterium YIM PH 21723]